MKLFGETVNKLSLRGDIMKNDIIDYLKRNRVSSTEVADALGKKGVIDGVYPLNSKKYKVGTVHWIYAYCESNWDVHEQVQDVKENDIVIVDVFDCKERAIFGDLVSKYLLLYKGVSAIVVNGNLRDVHRLIKEDWPIWLKGRSPIGCFNKKLDFQYDSEILNKSKNYYDGSIAVCDDSGVVIIPKEYHTEDFLDKIKFIEEQEDIWYECLDRKKMSTYEIVCLKKYLEE